MLKKINIVVRQSDILDGLPSKKGTKVSNQDSDHNGQAEPDLSTEIEETRSPRTRELMDRFDECCNSKKYSAFTLTFRECIRLHWKEDEIRRMVNNTLKGWAYLYYSKLDWFILPDIDRSGNYHYHGVIRIRRDLVPKFKRNITGKLGFMKVKYIDNPQRWINYCYKKEEYNEENVYTEEDSIHNACYKEDTTE